MTLGIYTPLRRLCIRQGISRAQLAAKVGITRQAIYNFDQGIHGASDATIIKLADALGVEPLEVAEALAEAHANYRAKQAA